MKLYSSKAAPNPKIVRMFLAEKGVAIDIVNIDLGAGENRQAPYVIEINPAGQVPALQLDSGAVITESTAICEYLDELYPTPPLIGTTPEERAETRMWSRRVDLEITSLLGSGYRGAEGHDFFKERMRVYPQAADDFKKGAQEGVTWLNDLMDGKTYLCGDRFTLADINLYCWLSFGVRVGQPFADTNSNIATWFERVGARDCAKA